MCVLISFCDVQARHFIGRDYSSTPAFGLLLFAVTDHRNGNKQQVARALCFMRVTREPGRPTRQQVEVEASENSAGF